MCASPVRGNAEAAGSHVVDVHQQLALLESFPPAIRELVLNAPVPEDLDNIRQILAMYGPEVGRLLIEQSWDQQFPGWGRPLKPAKRAHKRRYPLNVG